jgi:hypothetical protein
MRHVNEGQHAVIAPLRPQEKVLQVRQPLGVLREPLAPRVRVLLGLRGKAEGGGRGDVFKEESERGGGGQ